MEIERRFLVKSLPEGLDRYSHKRFVQGYLNTDPVLRVRREQDEYVFTYKGSGLLSRQEENHLISEEAFWHLIEKADGIIIEKDRYFIPEENGLCIELDVFAGALSPLIIAEVEFSSEKEADEYIPPDWFGEEVTYERGFSNSSMSKNGLPASFSKKETKDK